MLSQNLLGRSIVVGRLLLGFRAREPRLITTGRAPQTRELRRITAGRALLCLLLGLRAREPRRITTGRRHEADEAGEAGEADEADEDRPTEQILDNIWAPKSGFSLSISLCFGAVSGDSCGGVLWSNISKFF